MAELNSIKHGGTFKDLSEMLSGRLRVLEFAGRDKFGNSTWRCECDCGSVIVVVAAKLLSKTRPTRSCGCLQREMTAEKNRKNATHRDTHSLEYHSWKGMKQRCTNENDLGYKDYGGRGITVCQRWLDSYEAFREDMGKSPSSDHSIERVEVNGNYEPSNCIWATMRVQNRNTRRTQRFVYNGSLMSLPDLCDMAGKAKPTVSGRLKRGWSIEEALETPTGQARGKTDGCVRIQD